MFGFDSDFRISKNSDGFMYPSGCDKHPSADGFSAFANSFPKCQFCSQNGSDSSFFSAPKCSMSSFSTAFDNSDSFFSSFSRHQIKAPYCLESCSSGCGHRCRCRSKEFCGCESQSNHNHHDHHCGHSHHSHHDHHDQYENSTKVHFKKDSVDGHRRRDDTDVHVSVKEKDSLRTSSKSTLRAEVDVDVEVTEKHKAHSHIDHCHDSKIYRDEYVLKLHPNHVNQQPIQAKKCKICNFFCYGVCSIPYNPNARFKNKNFRLFPDYDFLPDNQIIPRDTTVFPKTDVDINNKWIKVKVRNPKKTYSNFAVDIFGDLVIISCKSSVAIPIGIPTPVPTPTPKSILTQTKLVRKRGLSFFSKKPAPAPAPVLPPVSPNNIDVEVNITSSEQGEYLRRSFVASMSEYELERANAYININKDFIVVIPKRRG